MEKIRLDKYLFNRGIVSSRSQAESYIKLGYVEVDGKVVRRPNQAISEKNEVKITASNQYVSRAALKLESVTGSLGLNFRGKSVLDVGSSTGGFSDYALRHGARRVIAVEKGKNQLHPKLRNEPKIELHEQTDIKDLKKLSTKIDLTLIDVSFVSIRDILPVVARLVGDNCEIVAMVKPQFEARQSHLKHKGVIKNQRVRRDILKSFEDWLLDDFKVIKKADSLVAGEKGNLERFYLLAKLR